MISLEDIKFLLFLILPFFYLLSLISEQYGYLLRLIGLYLNNSGLGYSLHTQWATVTRLSTILAGVLISFGIESNLVKVSDVAIRTSIILSLLLLFPLIYRKYILFLSKLFFNYYCIWDKFKKEEKHNYWRIYRGIFQKNLSLKNFFISKENFNYLAATFISFLLIVGGFFAAYRIAEININYRLTSVSFSPAMTGLGTLLAIFLVDPYLSKQKNVENYKNLMLLGWFSRSMACIAVAILFFLTK